MGNEYSRGPVKPCIETWRPKTWAELLEAHERFKERIIKDSVDPFFLTRSTFQQVFRSTDSISVIIESFRVLDIVNKGRVCMVDVFGGLALLTEAQLVVKFKCKLSFAYGSQFISLG